MKAIDRISRPQEGDVLFSCLRNVMEIIFAFEYIGHPIVLRYEDNKKSILFEDVSDLVKRLFTTFVDRFSNSKRRPDISELTIRLTDDFYKHLYVNRIVTERELLYKSFQRKTVLITGFNGVGKTCLSYNNFLALNKYNKCIAFYLDVRKIVSEHKPPRSREELCSIIFKEMYKHIFRDNDYSKYRWGNLDAFVAYSIRHHPNLAYEKFRTGVEFTMGSLHRIKDNKMLKVARKRLGNELLDLSETNDGSNDLINLIKFINRDFPNCIITIDNADQFDTNIQSELLEKVEDVLSRGDTKITPILCFRTSNIKRLTAREPHRTVTYCIDLIRKEKRDISLITDYETCSEVLARRLDYLLEQDVDLLFLDDFYHVKIDDSYLKRLIDNVQTEPFKILSEYFKEYPEQQKRFYDDFKHFSGLLTRYPGAMELVCKWNNDSIRWFSRKAFFIISDIISNRDTELNLRNLIEEDSELVKRKLRSHVIKRIINGNHLLRIDEDKLYRLNRINIFENIASENIHILKMKILEVLYNQFKKTGNYIIEYRELINIFSEYKIEKEEVFKCLNEMRSKEDVFALIIIDKSRKKISIDMDDTTRIELLPAGRIFVEQISVSCEYLFWMAINTELGESVIKGEVEYKETHNETFKIDVVVKFLGMIALKIIEEMKILFGDGAQANKISAYEERHRIDGKLYIERVYNKLRFYVKNDLSEIEKDKQKEVCDEIKKIVDSIDNEMNEYRGYLK